MTTRCYQPLLFCSMLLFLSCYGQRRSEQSGNTTLNRLSGSNSPYLLEHADNPVNWYEWGDEALHKAKQENKPLIISIGYASCHWCHVMEEESFMDTAVARIMNENFVAIKIDREERPDIDQVYLNAAQILSGGAAGWPLNAFALPDGRPFYAATYFPKEQWIKVLGQVRDAFEKQNDKLVAQAEALTKGIREQDVIAAPADNTRSFNKKTYHNAFTTVSSYVDFKYGGLIGAPKFPMPSDWEFMLQYHHLTGNKKALDAVSVTLDAMAKGGIFDQIGGGFARYSTDGAWTVPHFEKMLYDNGQLASLYAHAYQVTQNPYYREIIGKTLEFVKRELTSADGGFYASINADSEGEEGKFYTWTKDEVKNNLRGKNAELMVDYFQVTDSGNWERGKNILLPKNRAAFANQHNFTTSEFSSMVREAESILLQARNKRVHPSVDDKILTSWNAIMLKGYVDAYFATGESDYLEVALKNAAFLENKMMRKEGGLWRSCKDGKVAIPAFLDDYALLAKAFQQLYQATFDVHWLSQSRTLIDFAIAHFRDKESGLFFFTSDQAGNLVARKMEISDNVIPSSNSVLAEVLFYLGEYFDEHTYTEISVGMLKRVEKDLTSQAPYYANWNSLLGMMSYQPYEVAIMGDHANQLGLEMQKKFLPLAIFMGGKNENLPLLENKLVRGQTTIYVCRNSVCKLPVNDVSQALLQLK